MCKKMTIGLTDACSEENVCVMRSYAEAVRRGGHLPIVLPATSDREEARRQLQLVDVLLLPGGGDIAASRFGAEPTPYDGAPNAMRDSYEWLMLEAACEVRKPVFGICRGLQMINVFFGGTLWQDLPSQWSKPATLPAVIGGEEPQPLIEHSRPDKKWEPVHKICIDSQSWLSRVIGVTEAEVNSTHHQAVKLLGKGLRAIAWSEDGVTEAIVSDLYPITAVQFHPERLAWGDDKVFTRLFEHFITRTSFDTPRGTR